MLGVDKSTWLCDGGGAGDTGAGLGGYDYGEVAEGYEAGWSTPSELSQEMAESEEASMGLGGAISQPGIGGGRGGELPLVQGEAEKKAEPAVRVGETEEEYQARRRRKRPTLLTSGQGLLGAAPGQRKTLLGQ